MCGRYGMIYIEEIESRFGIDKFELKDNYNVAPTQKMPVIRLDDGKRHVELMRWGIRRMLGKDIVRDLINTRSDKAFGSFWKKQVINQRVLVPASYFFEWKKDGSTKTPYLIKPKDEAIFAFAGIWNTWTDEAGNKIDEYSIMTTDPNAEMKSIHDRMPVILHEDEYIDWLLPDQSPDRLSELLMPSEDGRLEMYAVSKDVNNVRNNDEHLLQPV